MNILVTIDNKIIEEFKIMIQSVKKHNDSLNVYIMYNDLSNKNIKAIKDFFKEKEIGDVSFIKSLEELSVKMVLEHITETTFLRLFAPYYLDTNIDRILYLDYDIVCTNNISDFYNMDFEDKTIIGCIDFCLSDESPNYINAGVLLINPQRYREIISKEEIINYMNENKDSLPYQDQTVLNNLFVNEIKLADVTYNYQINSVEEEYDYAIIVHYVTGKKPWKETYNQPIKAIPYYNLLANLGYKEKAEQLSLKHFENEYRDFYASNDDKSKSLDIIMPSYNATSTIRKTLDSIAGQVLDGINITVYLIDDASSEDYMPIVEEYKNKLSLKYYRMEKNSGVALARQKGIDEGRGDFFTIIDSDDYFISPYAIQELYNIMVVSGADVLRTIFVEEYNWDYNSYKLYRHDNIACHGKVYKRQFILDHNITYLDMRGNEDTAYNALLKACDAIYYDANLLTYRWCYNKESFTRKDEMYHETDLITFAHGFAWTAEEIYKRRNYLKNIGNKISELIGRVYARINNCWYIETQNSMYEETAKVYLIYRMVTGENIVPKILRQYDMTDDRDIYYNFLSRLEDEMFKLKEYKELSKEEKKKISALYIDDSKRKYNTISKKSDIKDNIILGNNTNIEYPINMNGFTAKLIISDDVSISKDLTIEGSSDIKIGKNTIISNNVTIITNGRPTNSSLRKYTYTNSVTIGDNCYIGNNVLLCPGVVIGDNCYIENGSVVLDSIEDNSIARGNPCSVFSHLDYFDDLFYNCDKKINWEEID